MRRGKAKERRVWIFVVLNEEGTVGSLLTSQDSREY